MTSRIFEIQYWRPENQFMKKQDLTKLSKSDELSILAIQEEVLEELEKKQSMSRDNGRL